MRPALLVLAAAWLGGGLIGQNEPPQERALPPPQTRGQVSVEEAIAKRRSVREFSAQALTWEEIGQLAWAAQGITEPRKRLRAAPSAGGLYPLELYFVAQQGTFHYLPEGHKMQVLSTQDQREQLAAAVRGSGPVRAAPLSIVLTAVYERTAERWPTEGELYVHLEAGHVGENIHLQAVALGLASVDIGATATLRSSDTSLRSTSQSEAVQQALGLPADHKLVYIIAVGRPV